MHATHRLIERVRSTLPTKSNYAVAKCLHMPQAQLSAVLAGKYGLGPKAVIRIAEVLDMPTRDVLVLIEEDKAKTEDDREFWGRRSPRISTALALATLAFHAVDLKADAFVNTVHKISCDATAYTLCEVKTCDR